MMYTLKTLTAVGGVAVLSTLGQAQTIYTQDFTAPSALTSNNGQFELGGNSDAADIVFGDWTFYAPNGGINQEAAGDGSGVGNGNGLSSIGEARPMDWRGTNARAVAVVLDPALFAATGAGTYTVSFDVKGDAEGNPPNATRYFLDLVSGYDLSGSGSAGLLVDVTHNGWGDILLGVGNSPFAANGSTTVVPTAEGAFDATVDGTISFNFEYDGTSAVAFAVATYNNNYAMDNVTVSVAVPDLSWWNESPKTGEGWRNSGEGYPDEVGIGWMFDGFWPWIYTYGMGEGGDADWVYIIDGGSRSLFWGYNFDLAYWFLGSSDTGIYYIYNDTTPYNYNL
jgi:hypothetical protein